MSSSLQDNNCCIRLHGQSGSLPKDCSPFRRMRKSMGQQIVSGGKSKTFPVLLSVHCGDHPIPSHSIPLSWAQFIYFRALTSIVVQRTWIIVRSEYNFIGLLFVVKLCWGWVFISHTHTHTHSSTRRTRKGSTRDAKGEWVFTENITMAAGVGNRLNAVWLYEPNLDWAGILRRSSTTVDG